MHKRLLSLLLIFCLLLTAFTGCKDKSVQTMADVSSGHHSTNSDPLSGLGDQLAPLLKNINIDVGELSPVFSSTVFSYSVTVPNDCTAINITPDYDKNSASIDIEGPTELEVGQNEYDIIVGNGKSSSKYHLNVTRQGSDNTNLTSLSIKGFGISPSFSVDTLEYISNVKSDTEAVDIIAETEDINAKVNITGSDKLSYGDNTILITVTSASGNSTKEYKITVKRPTAEQEAAQSTAPPVVDDGQKYVAITFDDGPSKYTNKLLDILDKHSVKATFYIVGERISYYPEYLKRAADSGHAFGNHSWDHSNLSKLSDEQKRANLQQTSDKLFEVCGKRPTTIRPPGGNWDRSVKVFDGCNVVYWSVDPEDWKYRNTETVVNNIMSQVGNKSIILLHDLYETSVDAADIVIGKLKEQGYTFVTVDEMLKIKGIT